MAVHNMVEKVCLCRVCEISKRIQSFIPKLPDELKDEATKLIGDLWDEAEDASTELGAIHAKIAGGWPTDHTGGKHLVRVGKEMYEIHATKVEENATKE